MSRKPLILSALLLISVLFIIAGKPVTASAAENGNICKGVFIDQVDVSNMTKEQAEAAVRDFTDGLKVRGIAITVGDDVVYETMADMGYEADITGAVNEAMTVGETGNLIKRYKEMKDVEHGNLVLPLSFSYDEKKIKDIVKDEVSSFNVAPVNASVKIKDGKPVYKDQVVGSKVNIEKTTKVIEDAINQWNRQDVVVNAVVEDDMPKYTTDLVKKCDTVLGSFTTEYASSAPGRAANLANGARLINNTVLYPGDVFSAYKYLSPFTEENGYKVAGAYLQGKVIDSVGGGACQVTTTLYNAVLTSELEVVERESHSMTISYVDLSRDAAIAGTSKDFKFKNNTDTPILIEASTRNRTITFKIWGHETRDTEKRKIEFKSEVISKTNPPADVITKDPTKPTSYREVTNAAHTGYRAKLWKIIYENGVQTDKILVNSSNYQSSAKCITVGTKEEAPKDNNDQVDNKDEKSVETISDEVQDNEAEAEESTLGNDN